MSAHGEGAGPTYFDVRGAWALLFRAGLLEAPRKTHTLEEAGELLGVTRERIRQLESRVGTYMRQRTYEMAHEPGRWRGPVVRMGNREYVERLRQAELNDWLRRKLEHDFEPTTVEVVRCMRALYWSGDLSQGAFRDELQQIRAALRRLERALATVPEP